MNTVIARLSCGLLVLLASQALAQSSTLLGTVIDVQSRQPVADVVVTVTSPTLQGEKSAVTDARGEYRIPQLPPGVYVLRFEKESYKPYARSDVQLRLNRTIRVNVELLPESLSEVVEIVGAPARIGVGSTTTGVNADQEFIRRGPSAPPRSSFEALTRLAPGGQSDSSGVAIAAESIVSVAPSQYNLSPAMPGMSMTLRLHPLPAQQEPRPPPRREPMTRERFSAMYFKGYGVNPTVNPKDERFSTFSVDTDTASYSLTRGYLNRQVMPDERAVRVEEFVNTFDYGYADSKDAPFGIHVEGFPSPVRKGFQVLRIGVKAREVPAAQRKSSHLVFVIDVSGSMEAENRLGLVKQALRLLVMELDERDRVSLVVYGSEARQVLPPTSALEKGRLLSAIDGLRTEGSTNAEAGLSLGYRIAVEHLRDGGINRVILCSDGVANVGVSDADGIWAQVKSLAARGITLSTVGFGMGNYNDVLMERLSHVGEGNYAYVDDLKEAHRVFVRDLTGTLQVVAKDVKLQVEFDPEAVELYRLLGYENRALTAEQFRDDQVDAGEVGAGHSVTALYEVKPREDARTLGTLRIRYKAPEGGASKELATPMSAASLRPSFAQARESTRLAYVASAFAEKLRGSYWTRPLTYDVLLELWGGVGLELRQRADVSELGELIRKASGLDRRVDPFEDFAPVKSMDFDRAPSGA
ncbi:von Willebrand factor type A domain-containing protein [Myxococcus stipitatus DSM 14675]|uniref:von Willebrand factor type A domain-containing protein n=1 Tax=Myxococcus stipitatus (strain DSM 14675 / JCM 12634 / Mx s8) TaxID=1278073 RepID=L7UBC3_MYXSD|nr:von Willebrand factor type A domain-containing protein [Myxococcus stipitatus]AGC43769.1 von Willebrand factor type A domain-containing protein [Myxococcus stipitatus DSM 14675]